MMFDGNCQLLYEFGMGELKSWGWEDSRIGAGTNSYKVITNWDVNLHIHGEIFEQDVEVIQLVQIFINFNK